MLSPLIMNQERQEEVCISRTTQHTNTTCTVCWWTMCTFYQYVVSSMSTVKNLLFDHQVTCSDPLSIQQQPSIQSSHSNEYQVCKSEVLQLPNGAEILPRIVSDRKQGKPPITQPIIECFGLHLVQARTDT